MARLFIDQGFNVTTYWLGDDALASARAVSRQVGRLLRDGVQIDRISVIGSGPRHLAQASDSTLLVSARDKLHNAGAIVADMNSTAVGMLVFDRFTSGREGTLAYYHSLSKGFSKRGLAAA